MPTIADIADNRCVQCGHPQVDNGVTAPMAHLALKGIHSTAEDMVSIHLDCMPKHIEDAHREGGYGDVIDAAKAGTRGDELLALMPAVGFDHTATENEEAS